MTFCHNTSTLFLEGVCDYRSSKKVIDLGGVQKIKISCLRLEKLDFSFAIFVDEMLRHQGVQYELIDAATKCQEIFDLIRHRRGFVPQKEKRRILESLGRWVYGWLEGLRNFCTFFGLFVFNLFRTMIQPTLLRFSALLFHINNSGFRALPVGIITCAIVSAAISIQGVIQLQKMGVPLASVETMAKLALREMGPFILALVIAGRSASSFAAQIGVMRITEELDAMKIMGFDWYRFIVIPRFLALVIAMPLLVFLADMASLFASAVVIKIQTGITFGQYIERFYEHVDLSHLWVGVIKSPFFGAVIALVGCYRGLQIVGDTQSVGKYTTISVVSALFWIIVVNAIFSIIFTRFDI
ncbi:MlaE family ABC transporter permease [Helicobacter pametensis]|uniref:MlaE family ABC transporter permease n=1 Tax=Helicobacter pametensis TaxID=95149 RepID=UPI0004BAEBCF|nr:ABC transporter permease [Helicobacter pametensis]